MGRLAKLVTWLSSNSKPDISRKSGTPFTNYTKPKQSIRTKIVVRHGFKLNKAKTKVQCSKAGRRIITGIAVGERDIAITRDVRRRIRAAHHQDEHGLRQRNIRRILKNRRYWKKRRPLRFRFYHQMKGLIEWAKLKPPAPVAGEQPKNKVIAAAARVVTAVCGQSVSNKVFGSWSRRFG